MVELQSFFEGSFEILQIIGVIISISVISKIIFDYKKDNLGKGSLIFWISIWVSALFVFIFPKSAETVFTVLEKGDAFTIALILSNIVLFVLVYILFNRIFSMNKKIISLIQKLALVEKIESDEEKLNEDD